MLNLARTLLAAIFFTGLVLLLIGAGTTSWLVRCIGLSLALVLATLGALFGIRRQQGLASPVVAALRR